MNYPTEADANGNGEVLVVLDLRMDESLKLQGVAREVVNRFQRMRKKAGLQVRSCALALYYGLLRLTKLYCLLPVRSGAICRGPGL